MLNINLINTFLLIPPQQVPTGTNKFFEWYFYGLQGLGGWFIFFLLAVAAVIWLMYDSQKRRLPAIGWHIGVVILACLLLPTILYRFTITPLHFELSRLLKLYGGPTQDLMTAIAQNFPDMATMTYQQLMNSLPPLTPFGEIVFYLGILGGVLAPVLAVGYFVTFQGMVGCPQGHLYEVELGECPECAAMRVPPPPLYSPPPHPGYDEYQREPHGGRPPKPSCPKLSYAWLIDTANNRQYDLCQDTTRIGRGDDLDIVIKDPAISRSHASIREAYGHCTLSDIGAKSGILLNDRKLRGPQVLQNGDEITLGDTILRFVSSR